MTSSTSQQVFANSEIGRLRRLIIHSPDAGLGKVIPEKAQDWLFEDIIHLETMRAEYDLYTKILLYFLDPEKIQGKLSEIDRMDGKRDFYKPSSSHYFRSDKVVDSQYLIADILDIPHVKNQLVAAICAHERVSYPVQSQLLSMSSTELARTLISGILPEGKMIFPPIPNFIFTRDIAVVVNDHIMLTKPATQARSREGILTTYILFNHEYFAQYRDKIIVIANNDDYFLYDKYEKKYKRVSVEGGDVMTIAPNHLLIGLSERTTLHGVSRVIQELFNKRVVEKISVIKIPNKRAFMHIDTTFTQVKRNMWVIYAPFSKEGVQYDRQDLIEALGEKTQAFSVEIQQFYIENINKPERFDYLEDLLDDVSQRDLKSLEKTKFIYSGEGVFPFGQREQWTDSCNVLALKEGVVVAYDRNDKTAEGFRKKGFRVVKAADLIADFESGVLQPDQVTDTLILLPSGELSRARGGSHCMSLPLLRDSIF